MKPDYILKPGMKLLGIDELRAHQVRPIQSLLHGNDTVKPASTDSKFATVPALNIED